MEDETWFPVCAPCECATNDGKQEGTIVEICRSGVRVESELSVQEKVAMRIKFRIFATSTPIQIAADVATVADGGFTARFSNLQAVMKNALRIVLKKLRQRDAGAMSKMSLLEDGRS